MPRIGRLVCDPNHAEWKVWNCSAVPLRWPVIYPDLNSEREGPARSEPATSYLRR